MNYSANKNEERPLLLQQMEIRQGEMIMKKLTLKKETVSSLANAEMKDILGMAGTNTGCANNDNCISRPWACYTGPNYPTCKLVTCPCPPTPSTSPKCWEPE